MTFIDKDGLRRILIRSTGFLLVVAACGEVARFIAAWLGPVCNGSSASFEVIIYATFL